MSLTTASGDTTSSMGSESKADYAPLPIRPPNATFERRADGSVLIEQHYDLPPPWLSIPHLFQARATAFPERAFVARRALLPDGSRGAWEALLYGEALSKTRSLAQAFIDLGLGPKSGIMVLSGPSADHMVVNLAAQMARAPYVPASVNYSLNGGDYARLSHIFAICRPKLIFADDWETYAPAMRFLAAKSRVILVTSCPAPDGETMGLDALTQTEAGEAVDRSIDAITLDQHAKTVFTSGSTGKPKGVIQTQRMLTAVVAQHDALYIRDEQYGSGEAYLSWMPWSHVGGNNTLSADVINDAATFYIDDGRPVAGLFDETIRNLREVHPREYGSTPLFFNALVGAMETDTALRDGFFSRMILLSYSAAGLSEDLFQRLQALSVAATGRRIPIITKYGTTETQGTTMATTPLERTGPIGLPFPGIALKLAPVGDKLEIRVKGPTVTPGYLGDPVATAAAFDEEGYYRTGDAARFLDETQPALGLVFDGRVVENFKLASGTWVHVGALRMSLIEALAPIVQDVVIAGENRDDIRILVWLRDLEAQQMAGQPIAAKNYGTNSRIQAHLRTRLTAFNATAGGQSRRVAALLILSDLPNGDEIAEKGYVNQRAVLAKRIADVDRLYAIPATLA